MTKQEAYESLLRKCQLTEQEFMRIYSLWRTPRYQEEIAKLSKDQQARFPHLFVAYRQLLRERGELND